MRRKSSNRTQLLSHDAVPEMNREPVPLPSPKEHPTLFFYA